MRTILALCLALGACAPTLPRVRYLDVVQQLDDESTVTRPSSGGCDTDDTCEAEESDPYALASQCVTW